MNPEAKVAAIKALLDGFTSHGVDSRGEVEVTVHDHFYLDTDFFPDLFKILDAD